LLSSLGIMVACTGGAMFGDAVFVLYIVRPSAWLCLVLAHLLSSVNCGGHRVDSRSLHAQAISLGVVIHPKAIACVAKSRSLRRGNRIPRVSACLRILSRKIQDRDLLLLSSLFWVLYQHRR